MTGYVTSFYSTLPTGHYFILLSYCLFFLYFQVFRSETLFEREHTLWFCMAYHVMSWCYLIITTLRGSRFRPLITSHPRSGKEYVTKLQKCILRIQFRYVKMEIKNTNFDSSSDVLPDKVAFPHFETTNWSTSVLEKVIKSVRTKFRF